MINSTTTRKITIVLQKPNANSHLKSKSIYIHILQRKVSPKKQDRKKEKEEKEEYSLQIFAAFENFACITFLVRLVAV